MADSEQDWIKKRAYALWEQEGYPAGKDQEHWEQAKLEYATQSPKGSGKPPAAIPRKKAATAVKPPKVATATPEKTKSEKKAAAPKKAAAAESAPAKTASEAPAPKPAAPKPAAAMPAAVEPAKKRSKKVAPGK